MSHEQSTARMRQLRCISPIETATAWPLGYVRCEVWPQSKAVTSAGLLAEPQEREVVSFDTSMFDTEKFICEVELRPTIWNVSSKCYSKKINVKNIKFEKSCAIFLLTDS